MADETKVNESNLVDKAKISKFKLGAGETLRLKGVNAKILREFLEQMGGIDHIINNIDDDGTDKEEDAANRLFMYLAGFGVENELPEYALEELETLGIESKSKRVLKAHWIRAISTNQECNELVFRIFALSVE